MAIEYINTLQGEILNSYNNEALANLGQRMGAKGDSIVIKKFNIESLLKKKENVTIPENAVRYIVLSYEIGSNNLSIYADGEKDGVSKYYTFIQNDSKTTSIIPIEYIGLEGTPQIVNCNVSKNIANNVYTYFFTGVLQNMPIALEFGVKDNKYISMHCLFITNNALYEYDYLNEVANYYKYDLVAAPESFVDSTSIDNIKERLGISTPDELNVLENNDTYRTALDYYVNILPKYIIALYNENEYFYNDSVGLKIEILKSIVNELYNDNSVKYDIYNGDTTNNEIHNSNPFFVYLPLNFEISFYANDNTGEYYDSLPINAKFIEEIIENNSVDVPEIFLRDAEINGYIVVDSSIEKAGAYKVIMSYSPDKSINLTTTKLYSIPYIGKDNYWYINDIKTEVTATGKDAGNPNIVVLQTSVDTSKLNCLYPEYEQNPDNYYSQNGPIILHTYNGIKLSEIFDKTDKNLEEFSYFLQTGNNVNVANSVANTYTFKVSLPSIYPISTENGGKNLGLIDNEYFDTIIKNSLFIYVVDNRLSIYNDGFNVTDDNRDTFDVRNISLQYTLTNNVNEQSFTTVLFQIVTNENNQYEWRPISNKDSNVVLDLGSMIASPEFARLYVKTGYAPDNYMFSYLLFDKIQDNLKNNAGQSLNIFPIIKNDTSEYYRDNNVEVVNNENNTSLYYVNNLNLTPKFIKLDVNTLDSDYVGELTNNDLHDKEQNGYNIDKFFRITDNKITDCTFKIDTNPIDNIPYVKITSTNGQIGSDSLEGNILPMFDFREVITTNQTAMNRLSLISIASSGVAYNAYIGNSANTNEEGTLYIGSSNTNYSMSGNKTVTDDYNGFKQFNKINFELPVETNNLTIYKVSDNKYFTYINVNTEKSSYIHGNENTINSIYMGNASYTTYTFDAREYIEDTYSGFINTDEIPESIDLSNVTYDNDDPNKNETLPSSLLFIVNFSSYTGGKYIANSIEQIASSDSIIEGITILGNSNSNAEQTEEQNDTQSQVIVEQ